MFKVYLFLLMLFSLADHNGLAQTQYYSSSFRQSEMRIELQLDLNSQGSISNLKRQPPPADRNQDAKRLMTVGKILLVTGGLLALTGFIINDHGRKRNEVAGFEPIGGCLVAAGTFFTVIGVLNMPKKHHIRTAE